MNIARFEGGPLDGITTELASWPPPDQLSAIGEAPPPEATKFYVLKHNSQLTDEQAAAAPNIARGALYQWRELQPA